MHIEKIKTFLQESNITAYRLAKECKIPISDIYQVLKRKKPLFPKWQKSIEKYIEKNSEVQKEGENSADNGSN